MNASKSLNTSGLAILLLATIVGCAETTVEKPVAKATVQGRWSGYENGRTEKITLEFTGNRFTYWDAEGKEIGSGTFVENDTVQPMQMDLTFEKIPSQEYVDKVGLAVFELHGNELKIAGSEPGSTLRPSNVAGGEGVRAFVFTRE